MPVPNFKALVSLPNEHPVPVIFRTYTLALSLALGPAALSLLTSKKARAKGLLATVFRILSRELAISGFPFAITVAVGGGAVLRHALSLLDSEEADLERIYGAAIGARLGAFKARLARAPEEDRAFYCNALAASFSILLLQSRRLSRGHPPGELLPLTPPLASGRKVSPTLDLTLLVMVRAIDALVQRGLFGRQENESDEVRDKRRRLTTKIDALVFWASSARIMWCFFYRPSTLPRSYVQWISSLANLDRRIVTTLQDIRKGKFSYVRGVAPTPGILEDCAGDLGYPRAWGNPALVPAYGRPSATTQWQKLGLTCRRTGGIPCAVVHGTVTGHSCTKNFALRAVYAFLEAVALYLPVHILPTVLSNPRALLSLQKLLPIAFGTVRSATFLAGFVSSFWGGVCLTRSVLLARLLPSVSHDFWDGPYGCIMAGCLISGSSIWIEDGRRRGEIGLYVLPRAIRSFLPHRWLTSGGYGVQAAERLAYTLSLAYLLTAAQYHPASLRGLAKGTLAFVTKGRFGDRRPKPKDKAVTAREQDSGL
ncbi:hypothetical protein PENSPDRAFT_621204 [Peniophora sp. CONT]|nr:hypothetical protein PENSPDRAFT_621204 [Peniophora sp. CONT]